MPPRHGLTLVGKGVCFDSGRLDIKPAAGIRLMKKDMGGAAVMTGSPAWSWRPASTSACACSSRRSRTASRQLRLPPAATCWRPGRGSRSRSATPTPRAG
ncbi:MAG: hypothetical protein R3C69_18065 [Geminicoccaceae bacterium]